MLGFSSLFAFEHLTSENFDEKIKGKKVVVDFYASWCPPCKIVAKNLKEYKKIKPKDVTIYKVDIDEHKALLKRFKIQSIPTLMYFKDGKLLKTDVGIQSFGQIQKRVIQHFINK